MGWDQTPSTPNEKMQEENLNRNRYLKEQQENCICKNPNRPGHDCPYHNKDHCICNNKHAKNCGYHGYHKIERIYACEGGEKCKKESCENKGYHDYLGYCKNCIQRYLKFSKRSEIVQE
jgi:hypothetical protein